MLRAVRLTVGPHLRNSCVCNCARRVQAMSHRGSENDSNRPQTRMQKTNAKEFYCLTEKDVLAILWLLVEIYCHSPSKVFCLPVQLEPLAFEEKANRRYKNATPTKLYSTAEVSSLTCFSMHQLPSS